MSTLKLKNQQLTLENARLRTQIKVLQKRLRESEPDTVPRKKRVTIDLTAPIDLTNDDSAETEDRLVAYAIELSLK